MKNGKRPSRRQTELIESRRLNAENWFVVKDMPDALAIVNRISGKISLIYKTKGGGI